MQIKCSRGTKCCPRCIQVSHMSIRTWDIPIHVWANICIWGRTLFYYHHHYYYSTHYCTVYWMQRTRFVSYLILLNVIGGRSKGPWPFLNFKVLHRNSDFAIAHQLSGPPNFQQFPLPLLNIFHCLRCNLYRLL